MKRDKVIELLGWRLGDRTDVADRAAAELDFIQTAMLEANPWLPWFLETELAETFTDIGERRVKLPPDFLMEIEEQHLYITNAAGETSRLVKGDFDENMAKYATSGTPKGYSISGKYFQLFPIPDGEYKLEMRYYAKDTLMSTGDVETLWLKHASDLVLANLGMILAGKHFSDTTREAAFRADSSAAWTRLYNKHVAWEEVNKTRVMGREPK